MTFFWTVAPVGDYTAPASHAAGISEIAPSKRARNRRPAERGARALFEAASYDDVVRSWWDRHVDGLVATRRRQLEFEQRRGGLPGIDTEVAAYALHWLIHETFSQELVQHQRFDPEVVIETVAALILRAIGSGSG